MLDPRPASAGATYTQNLLDCSSDPDADGRLQVEHALLHKIGLLAAQRVRIVEALHRLRTVAPPEAWADDHNISSRNVISSNPASKTRSPNNTTKIRTTYGQRRGLTAPQWISEGRRCFSGFTSSAERSWKRGPTLVKPFQSMEIHTTAWKRRIRQQEERTLQTDLEEKNAKEEDRERFIAGIKEGTAFSGVIARSNEMMERRREKIIKAQAKDEATRKSYKFKARPVYITDEDWQTIQKRQETRRKERRKLRQEEVLLKSCLPSRMAMHANTKKVARTKAAEDKAPDDVGARRANGIRLIPPEKIREVLAKKQLLWDKQLATARSKNKPIVPKTMPMEERQKVYRVRAQERAQRERDKLNAARQLDEDEKQRKREKAFAANVPAVPRTTNSFLLKTAQVQARLNQERENAKREDERQLKLRAQQRETGRILAEVMKDIDRQQGRRTGLDANENKKARQKARDENAKYRKALKENMTRLEQSTVDRPTLWEQHDAVMRKEAAKRVALIKIAEKVFQSGSTRAHWKRGSAADRLFNEEEKAVLGMSSFDPV